MRRRSISISSIGWNQSAAGARAGARYAPRSRILDLGCGTGYFLYINKLLGHEVLGIDLDELPMFREMIELLQIPRAIGGSKRFNRCQNSTANSTSSRPI